MTYKLFYKSDVLFDIEYNLVKVPGKNLWYSELDCLPLVRGITIFLRDNISNQNFNIEDFIRDGEAIEELRGFLYERHDNRPKTYDKASDFHYHSFKNEMDELLKSFCHKYGLDIVID